MAYLEKANDYAAMGLQALAGEACHGSDEDIHMFLTYAPWEIVERLCSEFGLDPDSVRAWILFHDAKASIKSQLWRSK